MYQNICFVLPQMKDGWLKHEFSSREALGVQYICASLESKGMPYTLINAHAYRIAHEDVCRQIIDNDYKIVGVTCVSQRSYPSVKRFIQMLRKEYNFGGIIFTGGFFATLAYEEILRDLEDELDFLMRGEGELITVEIVEKLSAGKTIEEIDGILYCENGEIYGDRSTHYIEDLNVLPFPIRDINVLNNVSSETKNFKIVAGRGCYNNCSFCSIIIDGRPRKKRYRAPENVVDEIQELLEKYPGIAHFRFCDEIFYVNNKFGRDWVEEFSNLIKQRKLKFTFHIEMRAIDITRDELMKLKDVGLICVSVGYESGVQRILDEMRKHCTVEHNLRAAEIINATGLQHAISIITIIPTMSFDELMQNYWFLKKIGGYTPHNLYNKLNLYIGCEYENVLDKYGLLESKSLFYERSNFKYLDSRVQYYSNIIDKMKEKVLYCRKFIKYVSEKNINGNNIAPYYESIFGEFVLEFTDFCMDKLSVFEFYDRLYEEYIDLGIQKMTNKLVNFCVTNHYEYLLDLDELTEDYVFI